VPQDPHTIATDPHFEHQNRASTVENGATKTKIKPEPDEETASFGGNEFIPAGWPTRGDEPGGHPTA